MPRSLPAPTPSVQRPNLGAGLLLAFLQRYADQSSARSTRELDFARRVDAVPGARQRVEDAVKRWRAKSAGEQARLVGSTYASFDSATAFTDRDWQTRISAVLSSPLVQVGPGLRLSHQTVAQTPVGAAPFTLPDALDLHEGPIKRTIRPGDLTVSPEVELKATDAARKPGPLLGQMPTRLVAAKPLYQLEFAGIYARKETTWDQGTASDEVYACFSMMGDNASTWARRSAVYDKMDSGDDWREDPSPCILWGPAPLPEEALSLAVLLMESDFGNADEIASKWHDAAVVAACIVKYATGIDIPDKVADAAANLVNWIFNLGDDNLGSDSMLLSPGGIAYFASQPLIHFKIQLNYNFFLFHTDGDAMYYTFYRVRRVQ